MDQVRGGGTQRSSFCPEETTICFESIDLKREKAAGYLNVGARADADELRVGCASISKVRWMGLATAREERDFGGGGTVDDTVIPHGGTIPDLDVTNEGSRRSDKALRRDLRPHLRQIYQRSVLVVCSVD